MNQERGRMAVESLRGRRITMGATMAISTASVRNSSSN